MDRRPVTAHYADDGCRHCEETARAHSRPSNGGQIHTACDKWIRVERAEYGTKVHITEPQRGLDTSEHAMWANLSPRDVEQLIVMLINATWPDCSGCSMPDGRHWDTCPNRWDGRPTR